MKNLNVIMPYFDLVQNKMMNVGDKVECDDERAEHLIDGNFCVPETVDEVIEEPVKRGRKKKTAE